MRGTVKFFDEKKGWGFIVAEGGGADVFVHQTAIKMEGRRKLETAWVVEFDEVASERGREARNVRAIEPLKPLSSRVHSVVVDVNVDAVRCSSENHGVPVKELIYDAFDAAADKLIDQLVKNGEIKGDDDA